MLQRYECYCYVIESVGLEPEKRRRVCRSLWWSFTVGRPTSLMELGPGRVVVEGATTDLGVKLYLGPLPLLRAW